MASTQVLHYFVYIIISVCTHECLAQNGTFPPDVTVQAFKPKGFRIHMPGDPKIIFIRMMANIYETNSSSTAFRQFRQFVFQETNGYWIYEEPDIQLKIGNLINYEIFFGTNNAHIGDNLSTDDMKQFSCSGYEKTKTFIVEELFDRKEISIKKEKKCTTDVLLTEMPNRKLCSDDILLEEHFDDLLDPKLWEVQHYIPLDHPEHPFVSYQNIDSGTVFVAGGNLYIQPIVLTELYDFTEESLYKGSLDLNSGCTGRVCSMQAMGPVILPPIASGRVKSLIAFKYGTVHIKAKMPIGDWIYPEIVLEPLWNKYGSMYYSSGIIKIAMARGNKNMNNSDYSSEVLQSRPILNSFCKGVFDFYKNRRTDGGSWGDDFHVYSLTWTPGLIQMAVDNKAWVTFRPGAAGLRSWLPKSCRREWYTLLSGPKIAPFNELFSLSLGVAVGGTYEFPDDVVTDYGKPWRNSDPKAARDFWGARMNWLPTWTQPTLIVDYVKIVAI
ncbi:unnamed protein product [Leptosia nina]|uniref:Beta-1,3-glucan-binding protein n=1 Tax=Leptosia nina TaxID=320188 RepID=A0AAV1JA72_9NEOP